MADPSGYYAVLGVEGLKKRMQSCPRLTCLLLLLLVFLLLRLPLRCRSRRVRRMSRRHIERLGPGETVYSSYYSIPSHATQTALRFRLGAAQSSAMQQEALKWHPDKNPDNKALSVWSESQSFWWQKMSVCRRKLRKSSRPLQRHGRC